ncbi:MAG: hypothetical protein AB7H77_09340 [Bdellovibrionales bacterium]
MKKYILGTAVLSAVVLCAIHPAEARHGHGHSHFSVGLSVGSYYPAYYYPYYVSPPPVVYSVPPPVVYEAPPTIVYETAAAPVIVSGEPPPLSANQTSPTYIDSYGRTCRQFQSTAGGPAFGTACLQPDGSWRAVQ